MKIGSATIRSHSGSISPVMIALTTLGGFAAGALTVGIMASVGNPMSRDDGVPRISTVTTVEQSAARDTAMREIMATQPPDSSAVAPVGLWAFEAKTPGAPPPGKKRPDLLGAPEGWTPGP
jgi:hypothetical protein